MSIDFLAEKRLTGGIILRIQTWMSDVIVGNGMILTQRKTLTGLNGGIKK